MSSSTWPEVLEPFNPTGQLVPVGPGFVMDEVGLTVPTGTPPTMEACQVAASVLKNVHAALAYWIRDLVLLTEGLFAEEASQIIDKEFLSESEVSAFRFVASKVGSDIRRKAPSWQHARAVAGLNEAEQERWIQKALDEDWIASKLASEIKTAAAGGPQAMQYLLVVKCPTAARQEGLADRLEREGYGVTKRTSIKKADTPEAVKVKAARPKQPKKLPPVRTRRSTARPYQRRKGKKAAKR